MATETSPLVNSIEEGDVVHAAALPPIEAVTAREKIVNTLATISIAIQAVGIFLYGRSEKFVKLSLGMGCLIAPICAMQQRTITTVVNMNEAGKHLDQEVDNLEEDNKKLNSSLKEIELSVGKMEELEEALEIIKETKVIGLNMLEEEVGRSREILEGLEENVESKTLQNIIEIIFSVDKNNDSTLDYDEVTDLIGNLSSLQGVKVNEDLFRKKIQSTDESVNAVLEIVKNIIQENNDTDERILTIF